MPLTGTGLGRKESEGGEGLLFGMAFLEAFLMQWLGNEQALKLHYFETIHQVSDCRLTDVVCR